MDGIIIVNKEAGYTSHDVVAKLRGILHERRIGHTGTLDPAATGVLPVCIGRATKVCDVLTDRDKTYEAEVVLGITTDTLDTTGQVQTVNPVDVTRDGLITVLSQFKGEIEQIPPMYSAVKINGKKLYEYAREGVEIERKTRKVTIHDLELLESNIFTKNIDKNEFPNDSLTAEDIAGFPTFKLRITCSKGTYIRTLCDDIGRALGCGAAMHALVRTAVGRFSLENAHTLNDIELVMSSGSNDTAPTAATDSQGGIDEGAGRDCARHLPTDPAVLLIPIDSVFDHYPRADAAPEALKLLTNGNPLPARSVHSDASLRDGDIVRVYHSDEFYALYRFEANKNRFRVEKFFH